jgi:hypothetical protein
MRIDAFNPAKNPAWATLMHSQAFYAKLLELSVLNINAAFRFASDLSKAKSPQEFATISSDHIRDQFEAFSEQVEDLSATVRGTPSVGEASPQPALGD